MQSINSFWLHSWPHSFLRNQQNSRFVVLLMVSVLSACSMNTALKNSKVIDGDNTSSTQQSKNKNELKSISKSITDLVEIPQDSSTAGSNNTLTSTTNSTTKLRGTEKQAVNQFTAQQSMKISGVPSFVIDAYKKAVSLMEKEDWQGANTLFNQVIAQQPQLSGSYVNKAIIAKNQEQLILAQQYVEQAINANNLNPYAHHLKGQLLKQQGHFKQAEQSYLKALAIWPDYAQVHASMAVLLELYQGRLLDAYNYYSSYLILQPKDKQVQLWLAGLKIKLKRAGLTPKLVVNGD